MAGLIDPNDIAKARQSGYSDQEISTFLAGKHPEQFKTARDAGYSDKEIIDHLAPDERQPSGVVDGIWHGIAEAARGDASTIKLTGASTPGLDSAANTADAKNYKGASLIREGGHWYNPADYQPSALPQILAEQAPGLAQDASAGWAAGKLMPGGAAAKSLAGMGGFSGSALLRTFGPGAHANADAATGVPNSPVTAGNILREVGKQAVELPLNMVPGSRLFGRVAEKGLARAIPSVLESTGAGAANDLVDQLGTTAGSKDGLDVNGNRLVTSALSRAAGHSLLVAPKLAAETAADAKYSKIEADPHQQLAAQALAKRQLLIADGRNLVGPLGGTEVAAHAVNGAHTDVHSELADATKGEVLSQDNTNTLNRINKGDKVSPTEVKALAEEASLDTMHLARQAMLSKQLRDSGNISDDKFTGGIGGAMENLPLIRTPVKTLLGTGAAAIAGHAGLGTFAGTIGAVAPAALAAMAGVYGAGRMIDRLTGSRSPATSFTDRFGGTEAPVRLDTLPTADDPSAAGAAFNPSAGPWGARGEQGIPTVAPPQDAVAPPPTLRATLNSNAKIDEGMAKIAKQIGDQKRKSMIADAIPALQQLAATRQPPEAPAAPEAPNLSPIALKMLQQQLKQGRPPTPEPQPAPATAAPLTPSAPVDAFDALKPLSAANVMRKLTAQPEAAASVGEVSNAPASPAISELMRKLNPTATPAAPDAAPVAPPAPPVIAKIIKKMGKPMEETPHENAYTPMDASQLWGKGLSHEAFAEADASKLPDLKYPERYKEGIVRDRKLRQNTIGAVLGDETGPAASHAVDLLEELHHTRRADKASGAIHHFTAKMPPAMRDAMRAKLGKGFVSSIWTK
jgi:hypothetical protein